MGRLVSFEPTKDEFAIEQKNRDKIVESIKKKKDLGVVILARYKKNNTEEGTEVIVIRLNSDIKIKSLFDCFKSIDNAMQEIADEVGELQDQWSQKNKDDLDTIVSSESKNKNKNGNKQL